jgi:hypothetical protein
MALYLPKKVTLNWCKYDVSFSIELVQCFVEGIEKQAEESVSNFEKKMQIELVEDTANEYQSVAVRHQGLNDETWDLSTIFSEHFPSLQRRSALLTVCSYFEHELDKLCLLYQREKSFGLSHTDLRGDMGIDRATKYLEKLAKLDVHHTSREWNDIKAIQKIRNVLVHRGGKSQEDDSDYKAIAAFIDRMDSLRRDDEGEIVIGKGFLSYVVSTYASYFKLVGDSIRTVENPQA